ncbi:MAG: DUF2283 domain-containing protein [Bacteroidota bacterium]|nr:DUF2283 domain-containing protein [Bacteroidota bacterium]
MKVKFDKEVDVVYIKFTDLPIKESDEDKHGIILDYVEDGSIVSIEILNASKKIPNLNKFEYEIV